jgi:pyridoxine kinase
MGGDHQRAGCRRSENIHVVLVTESVTVSAHPRVETDLKGTGDLFCSELVSGIVEGKTVADAIRMAGDRVTDVMLYAVERLRRAYPPA